MWFQEDAIHIYFDQHTHIHTKPLKTWILKYAYIMIEQVCCDPLTKMQITWVFWKAWSKHMLKEQTHPLLSHRWFDIRQLIYRMRKYRSTVRGAEYFSDVSTSCLLDAFLKLFKSNLCLVRGIVFKLFMYVVGWLKVRLYLFRLCCCNKIL